MKKPKSIHPAPPRSPTSSAPDRGGPAPIHSTTIIPSLRWPRSPNSSTSVTTAIAPVTPTTVTCDWSTNTSGVIRPSSRMSQFRDYVLYVKIEVGTPVTGRPPRRSLRAIFPHRAPQRDAQTDTASIQSIQTVPPMQAGSVTRFSGTILSRRECFARVASLPTPSPCNRSYRL